MEPLVKLWTITITETGDDHKFAIIESVHEINPRKEPGRTFLRTQICSKTTRNPEEESDFVRHTPSKNMCLLLKLWGNLRLGRNLIWLDIHQLKTCVCCYNYLETSGIIRFCLTFFLIKSDSSYPNLGDTELASAFSELNWNISFWYLHKNGFSLQSPWTVSHRQCGRSDLPSHQCIQSKMYKWDHYIQRAKRSCLWYGLSHMMLRG